MNTVTEAPDVAPLAWVQDEVRRSLEGVHKTLRRLLREVDLRQAGGQIDVALTGNALQAQAAALHQVSGVLHLVGLPEGQKLMLSAEALLLRNVPTATLTAEQVEAVERAGFALMTYLTRQIAGARPSPLALFPTYRSLQELQQADRIHPADFWPQHFEWRTLPAPSLVDASLPPLDQLRGAFESALLRQMRQSSTTHAAHLAELSASIGLALAREPASSFWQLVAAHFEAQAQGMLASDTLVKRMASRLLGQLRSHLAGSHEVADRLVQDLLFFCAQSGESTADQAPRLRSVRQVYGLDEAPVDDYKKDRLGHIDPAWVQSAMRRVGAAKEAWNALAEGDSARSGGLDEAGTALTESLQQLFEGGEFLGQTLQRAAVVTLRSGSRPPAALAMEVASSLLYLEAALEDGVYDQPNQRPRIERLAARVQAAAIGQPADTLDGWMEDLFRRVADRQTLGSVVQELRASLGEVERLTDEYFRDPSQRQHLIAVPGQLQAMRGVFSVLGLDQASTTCVRMRDEIDRLSNTEVDISLAGPQAVFERLATNLGQLGFLIDMLSVQAPLAKSMFRFDEAKGELVASVERERRAAPPASPAPVAAAPAPAPAPAKAEVKPEVLAPAKAAPAAAAPVPLSLQSLDLPDLELDPLPQAVAAPVAAPAPVATPAPAPAPAVTAAPAPAAVEPAAEEEEVDAEMLEIFLEEADEVVGTARGALNTLSDTPADRNALTTVRRAFHTLKGSSRMVGLMAYGEAAWACEQLYNGRLADEKPVDDLLLAFSFEAIDELAAWRNDIASGNAAQRTPHSLRQKADAMRQIASASPSVAPAPVPFGDTVSSLAATEPMPLTGASTALPALEAPEEVERISLDDLEPALADFELTQPMPEALESVLPSTPEVESVDLVHLDLDFDAAPISAEALADGSFDIDLSLPAAAEPVPADALPALDLDLGTELPQTLPAGGAERLPPVAAELPPVELAPTEAMEAMEPAEVGIQVGPLRISESLYRIFNAEAEEHGERLLAVLSDWAAQPDEPPPSDTEVYAHALAGNAATVGFDSLSQLARTLEHALGRAQQAGQMPAADAQRFVDAAASMKHLLHGFANGELGKADAGLIKALQAYEPMAAPESDSLLAPLQMAAVATPEATALLLDADFPMGEPDQIDTELWEIFEEEAGELLHQLHARLRDWTTHPSDSARGDACMRTLHTFKGGARLAGAMHLGELAHKLEADVLTLLAQSVRSAAQVHPLQDLGDDLEQRFEALRKLQRQGGVVAAPVAAPAAVPAVAPIAAPAPAPQPPEALQPIQLPAAGASISTKPSRTPDEISWKRFSGQQARELSAADVAPLVSGQSMVRVRAALLDRLAAQSGEVSIRRARMENELTQMKSALLELDDNLERLRTQLRELEVQAEAQISSRQEAARSAGSDFDPLEFDRYTRFQEVTRMLAESVNDVATVQRSLQRNVAAGEDELAAQSRLTRELQDDLLSSRMVEFESIGERLHRVVRQAARESGKQVQLEVAGQGIELDRGVLERLIGAFEHLLRNSVVHGIESPDVRKKAGKEELGTIRIKLSQEGNQVLIAFSDDGAGLNLARIREKAVAQGLLEAKRQVTDAELIQLIYAPGFSTASQVTEMAGRGVGMDVVRAEVTTLGGYVLTRSQSGKGTEFDLRVPLTTALTQVVLLRCGELQVAVPASLVDTVLRLPNANLTQAYKDGQLQTGQWTVPIYWLGGLLAHSDHPQLHGKHAAVVLVHSGPDRIAIHVDEVMGNQEVVVKNLGQQLIHVPGLAGISLLASGSVALIYNPVALAERYGSYAIERAHAGGTEVIAPVVEQAPQAPLVLVVDDSLTVRRVTQRFLEREGFRVQVAKDGLDAMEQLAREELPAMVLSDIEMPRMDGFDLVRNLRADERLRGLPVVMITSRIAEKHRDYAAQLGVQGYLGKPYDEETLLGLIRHHTRTPATS